MEEKKLYYPKINPSDTQLISNDGGGILMNSEGKFMFSSVSQEKLEELYALDYNGKLPTNFNDVSIIGIMNQTSSPRTEIEEGNNNRTSIINPTSDTTTPAPPSNNICGGSGIDNKEFEEAAKVFSLWEELNSDAGNAGTLVFDNNGYKQNINFFNSLFNNPEIVKVIDQTIDLSSDVSLINLGWRRYGSGKDTLPANIGFMYSDYWVTNKDKNNTLSGDFASWKKNFINTLDNTTVLRSIFDIQTLPSGLRTMCLRTNYNSGQLWINRILITIGPDYLNIPNLGITIKESRSDGLSFDTKIAKFVTQYDQIIALYNKDKQTFLETLAKETTDFTVRLVDQGGITRYKERPDDFKVFYEVYINLSLSIALKYKDCPNEYILGTTTPTVTTTPPPPPTQQKPSEKKITTGEQEEGLYEVEFNSLPDNEDEEDEDWINDGAFGGVNNGDDLMILSQGQVIDISNTGKVNPGVNIVTIEFGSSTGSGGGGGGGGGGLGISEGYTLKATGIINDDINNALKTCKGASNVIETALKMNPLGYPPFNPQLPVWAYNNNNLILQAIQNKLGCPLNLHCAAGISLSFIVFNQTDFKNKSSEAGGFPITNSSYIVPTKKFTGVRVGFEKNIDWDPKTKCLTQSGIQKFEQAKKLTGGIFTIGSATAGHTGMIYYLELADKIDKKGNVLGKVGYYYTLEFNTHTKNQTSGGYLCFRRRPIGGNWGAKAGGDTLPVWFGDTSVYNGGKWAPNGLGSSNKYTFGESISFSKNIS